MKVRKNSNTDIDYEKIDTRRLGNAIRELRERSESKHRKFVNTLNNGNFIFALELKEESEKLLRQAKTLESIIHTAQRRQFHDNTKVNKNSPANQDESNW